MVIVQKTNPGPTFHFMRKASKLSLLSDLSSPLYLAMIAYYQSDKATESSRTAHAAQAIASRVSTAYYTTG